MFATIVSHVQDWDLPNEAFHPRHGIGECGTIPDPLSENPPDSPSSNNKSDFGPSVQRVNRVAEKSIREEILAVKPFSAAVPTIDFTQLVVDMLKQFAEEVGLLGKIYYVTMLLFTMLGRSSLLSG